MSFAAVVVESALAGMCVDIASASRRLEAKQDPELGRRTPRNRVDVKELAS